MINHDNGNIEGPFGQCCGISMCNNNASGNAKHNQCKLTRTIFARNGGFLGPNSIDLRSGHRVEKNKRMKKN